MNLPNLWFAIIAVVWTGFFVLEGFDLGVGALHRVLGRTETERRVVVNTIGPFWDGNEVWLIVGGAAIFAAFPAWYATWFSTGYLALLLVLLALIGRGLSFEWRLKGDSGHWRELWSWLMVIGSALIPLLLGVAVGDLLVGLPLDSAGNFTGTFWSLLTPYGLLLGVTLLALCLLHGAVFVSLRTDGEVRHRARALAGRLVWVAIVLGVVALGGTLAIAKSVPVAAVLAVVAALGLLFAAWSIRGGREGRAFIGTAVGIGAAVGAVFASLFPYVMVSSTDLAYSLTVAGTASGSYSLTVMTWVAVFMLPIVLIYTAWGYWVFRARLRVPEEAAGQEPVFVG